MNGWNRIDRCPWTSDGTATYVDWNKIVVGRNGTVIERNDIVVRRNGLVVGHNKTFVK